MKTRVIMFLDIDGVLVVGWPINKMTRWGWQEPFDRKCCNMLNSIYDEIPFEIVISSDWRNQRTLEQLKEIFEHYKIKAPIVGITPNSGKYIMQNLEGGRFEEINLYLETHKDDILAWVAVDDLKMVDLEHFVCTPKSSEGIKQTGIRKKIINELKLQINGE